jgi:Glyoxalase/Bleomycin resistance protein/Dioxygenase superfamily
MIPIEGLFEAHITVSDLQRSIAFYRDVVGLELGIEQPERPAAFFWVGGRGRSMLGVFSLGSCPLTMQHHVAFQVKLEDVLAAPLRLRAAGITPLGAGESRLTSRSSLLGAPPHPYSSMTRTETSWSTSRCCLMHHGLSWDWCHGANGKRSKPDTPNPRRELPKSV